MLLNSAFFYSLTSYANKTHMHSQIIVLHLMQIKHTCIHRLLSLYIHRC